MYIISKSQYTLSLMFLQAAFWCYCHLCWHRTFDCISTCADNKSGDKATMGRLYETGNWTTGLAFPCRFAHEQGKVLTLQVSIFFNFKFITKQIFKKQVTHYTNPVTRKQLKTNLGGYSVDYKYQKKIHAVFKCSDEQQF